MPGGRGLEKLVYDGTVAGLNHCAGCCCEEIGGTTRAFFFFFTDFALI